VTATPIGPVTTVPVTALAVFLFLMAYVLQSTLMPRVSAIALATFKSETAQPLFAILTLVGVCMLFLFVVIPYNTFGEDIKMLKDAGVKLILVLTIIQAVWGASTSISEEVEGRTALTVLSKPVTRSSFIIGKFLGIAWTVALMSAIFGVIFLIIVAYKPIYDEREGGFDAKEYGKIGFGAEGPTWEICHLEMSSVVPGLVLGFMETIVLTAISVAISTRLPMLANFIICFTIYVLGNLTPMIVKSGIGQFEIVSFVGQLIATIVPNLENFDIQAAVASGQLVPPLYLWWSLLYCLIYTLIAMLLALLLFEDRDMA
jgi:ABC-type transport system involved in multi-copper enzyme maturation permease subunit